MNRNLSDAFPIKNGTRQGCPLSPLLYALSLEPILNRLRSNQNIERIRMGETEHKLEAYADDIFFTLTDPLTSIPNLLEEFQLFHELANLCINYSKSLALNVSLPPSLQRHCSKVFPFLWKEQSIPYLGIQLPRDLAQLYAINHLPLIQSLKKGLMARSTMHISWFGHVATVKINLLPKVLYILQAITLKLLATFFSSL